MDRNSPSCPQEHTAECSEKVEGYRNNNSGGEGRRGGVIRICGSKEDKALSPRMWVGKAFNRWQFS